MIYKIYFEKRSINICSKDEPSLSDSNSIVLSIRPEDNLQEIISMFETSEGLGKIYIPAEDPDVMFRAICKCFVEVNAGGGLVENKRGDYLMIFRNGLWDLPKGKQEGDEPHEVTAFREVMEETGLTEIEMGELICVTHHCYRWKGQGDLILKHTYWYAMEYTIPAELIPQTEEDITKATWIARSSLPIFLSNTYPSILEVFHDRQRCLSLCPCPSL